MLEIVMPGLVLGMPARSSGVFTGFFASTLREPINAQFTWMSSERCRAFGRHPAPFCRSPT
ncbi:hypothetical protein [Bradyrhizobium guangdongense]|uniref:hypothetical protein n=1 Tax=Bradyrhizobium guangdongense TaxID=1325090 RepID=UPI0018F7D900|nr:hypothetical protein [Bradyrhizobium guangdongense]